MSFRPQDAESRSMKSHQRVAAFWVENTISSTERPLLSTSTLTASADDSFLMLLQDLAHSPNLQGSYSSFEE
jgi:hypothetical protein